MKQIILICLLITATSAFSQKRSFKVMYQNQILEDEQIIEIKTIESNGQMKFCATLETNDEVTIVIKNEYVYQVEGSSNDMCWKLMCFESFANFKMSAGEMTEGYCTYYPNGNKGTSKIKYTFRTSNEEDTPLSIYVDYNFSNEIVTSINETSDFNQIKVIQDNNSCFKIMNNSDADFYIMVYNLTGNIVQEVPISSNGSIETERLSSGCYLLAIRNNAGITIVRKGIIR